MERFDRFINEEVEDVDFLKNRILKKLYLNVRNLVDAAIEFKRSNPDKRVSPRLLRVDGWEKQGAGFTFRFDQSLIDAIKKIGYEASLPPNIGKGHQLYIRFKDQDGDHSMDRAGKMNIMNFASIVKNNEINYLKSVIQHELQHLFDVGDSGGEGAEGTIEYLASAGEVSAHAKQFAYLLYKDKEKQFSLEKVADKAGTQKQSVQNYINFKDSQNFVEKYGISDEHVKLAEAAYAKINELGQIYLDYFWNKDETDALEEAT